MNNKKEFKELTVQTDCGEIVVQEYDDGVANGVHILFEGVIVAAVDCYKTTVNRLPQEVAIPLEELDKDNLEESVVIWLSSHFGFCIESVLFETTDTRVITSKIVWDIISTGEPEARLLIYGPEGEDCDEPQDCIILN